MAIIIFFALIVFYINDFMLNVGWKHSEAVIGAGAWVRPGLALFKYTGW